MNAGKSLCNQQLGFINNVTCYARQPNKVGFQVDLGDYLMLGVKHQGSIAGILACCQSISVTLAR